MKLFLLVVLMLLNFYGRPVERNLNYHSLELSPECIGQKFPKFKINRSDGSAFSNADLKNKIAFVTFWKESSSNCVEQLGAFNEMFEKLKDRKNFIFVSFSPDNYLTINEIVLKNSIKYNFLHMDDSECLKLSHGFGFPSSFVIDKNGKILYYFPSKIITNKEAAKNVVSAEYNKVLEYL